MQLASAGAREAATVEVACLFSGALCRTILALASAVLCLTSSDERKRAD